MRNQLLLSFFIATLFIAVSCNSGGDSAKVTFVEDIENCKIEVNIDGKLFTALVWTDDISKPVLYPVRTSAGTEITRGFPFSPRLGERIDHAHQIGNWLTYGDVEGFDFWGNGSRGLGTRNENGGVIKLVKVNKVSGGKGQGKLVTSGVWVSPSGE